MPCYVTGSAEGDARLAADDARLEATKVTALLCSMCRYFDDEIETDVDSLHSMPPEVEAWWKEHKRIDAERTKRNRMV